MNRTYLCLLLLPQRLCFAQITEALIARAPAALEPKLVEIHRDLHMHPELSNKETRTNRIVAERLRAIGLEVRAGSGVVGLLKGASPGLWLPCGLTWKCSLSGRSGMSLVDRG